MSKSNASAKNRRAYGGNPPPSPVPSPQVNAQQQQQNNGTGSGFTLQQVIAVIDRRLLNLETFMKETKENPSKKSVEPATTNQLAPIHESVSDILNEFNARFDMIAEEVGSLKDIVLKLQSYTMDVNKTLLEERIHILSDLGSNSNQEFEPQLFDLIQNNQSETVNTTTSVDLQNLVKEEFATNSEQ
jgi:hypothetical protein